MPDECLVRVSDGDMVAVDREVAPLVQCLNQISDLITLDSCSGHGERDAYVYFTLAGGGNGLLTFVPELIKCLKADLDSCCEYRLRLEWLARDEAPLAQIIAQPDYIGILCDALKSPTVKHHMNQFADGK